jgi:hypothetical protein
MPVFFKSVTSGERQASHYFSGHQFPPSWLWQNVLLGASLPVTCNAAQLLSMSAPMLEIGDILVLHQTIMGERRVVTHLLEVFDPAPEEHNFLPNWEYRRGCRVLKMLDPRVFGAVPGPTQLVATIPPIRTVRIEALFPAVLPANYALQGGRVRAQLIQHAGVAQPIVHTIDPDLVQQLLVAPNGFI